MSFLVTLYWLWFGVSLAVLARRGVRKLWRTPTTPAAPTVPARGPLLLSDASATAADGEAAVRGAPAGSAPSPGVAVHPATVEPRPAAAPRPDRSPLAGARTSLAEALAGIRMPLDLAPLSTPAGADPTRRLVLSTTACPAPVVDAALTEELERLGFAVERTGPTEVLAHRGDHTVTLHVRPIVPLASSGPADPAYPTAPAGSVVVDLQLC
jgi:hypothetical protein